MYCRVKGGQRFAVRASSAFISLSACLQELIRSVKDVIIYDLGMDAWQNHLVGTVSLSGGGNLERS